MSETSVPPATPELFAGQPCVRLRLDADNHLLVALQGGHVLSWVANGAEQLYLSPRSLLDGRSAIRGGVPVCFPQFNQRGPLPKHGFARNLPWVAGEATAQAGAVQLALALDSSPVTLALWPHAFRLQLMLTLAPGRLALDVSVDNTGSAPLSFMLALHTYFRVADIAQTRVDGLDGCASWDSLVDVHSHQQGAIHFTGEFDRVFTAAAAPLQFTDGHKTVQVAQSASLGNTVVWNPGAAKCATLADMPPDGYVQMLCIEAAQIDAPITLAAGARWTGGQHLALV